MSSQSQKISGFTILVGTSGPHKYSKTNTYVYVYIHIYIRLHFFQVYLYSSFHDTNSCKADYICKK